MRAKRTLDTDVEMGRTRTCNWLYEYNSHRLGKQRSPPRKRSFILVQASENRRQNKVTYNGSEKKHRGT
ncbi:hypothetical protein GCM10009831_04230 [Dietzia cercidiphylli]|uniref:Transposase n=1 Tax=Dietzia cercidiphylli TaxID=498199 RepID=A0ABN2I5W9_9ACTN